MCQFILAYGYKEIPSLTELRPVLHSFFKRDRISGDQCIYDIQCCKYRRMCVAIIVCITSSNMDMLVEASVVQNDCVTMSCQIENTSGWMSSDCLFFWLIGIDLPAYLYLA